MKGSFNPIVFALRHPITVMAGVAALAVASLLAVKRMPIDIFPTLDLPVIYIAQPYGGLDPGQMESQITAYLEGHAINGQPVTSNSGLTNIGLPANAEKAE